MYKLEAKTYVNADSTKVVPEGSVDAAYLLGLEGDEISDETAERLGLLGGSNGYGEMKKAELEELAESKGLDVGSKATKADLVAALEESDAAAAEAGGGGTAQVENPAEA